VATVVVIAPRYRPTGSPAATSSRIQS